MVLVLCSGVIIAVIITLCSANLIIILWKRNREPINHPYSTIYYQKIDTIDTQLDEDGYMVPSPRSPDDLLPEIFIERQPKSSEKENNQWNQSINCQLTVIMTCEILIGGHPDVVTQWPSIGLQRCTPTCEHAYTLIGGGQTENRRGACSLEEDPAEALLDAINSIATEQHALRKFWNVILTI